MRNLIKRILKEENQEEDEFGWIKDYGILKFDTQMDPIDIYILYGFTDDIKDHVAKDFERQFGNLYVKGDRIYLETDGLCDFVTLFSDRENGGSQGSYINQYLAEKVLGCEDEWWEPYDYLNESWSDIWEIIVDNPMIYKYILEYIEESLVTPDNYDPKQLDIWGDLPKKRSITYIGKKVLDSEYFNQLKQDPKLLGKILWQNTDMGPFEIGRAHV